MEITHAARYVSELWSQYLEIHKHVFGFSVKKVFPFSILFTPPDYQSHYEKLFAIIEQLEEITYSLKIDIPTTDDAGSLKSYSEALVETALILHAICRGLDGKKHDNHVPYEKSLYAFDLRQYRLAIRKRKHLAKELRRHLSSFAYS